MDIWGQLRLLSGKKSVLMVMQKCYNFSKITKMNVELKKLKGCHIKTLIGQFTLKEYLRAENSQFDQIYFKSNQPDIIIKLYDLEQPISFDRYRNQIEQYQAKLMPMLHDNVHSEQLKIKKKDYGLVAFIGLNPDNCLSEMLTKLTQNQTYRLSVNMLDSIQALKKNNYLFCSFRPENIYKFQDRFVVINAEFMRSRCVRSEIGDFFLEVVDKDWEYWSPEVLDPYSKNFLDYTVDIFAIGCILYQVLKNGLYPFQSKLTAQSNFYSKIQEKGIIGQLTNFCLDSYENRKKLKIKEIGKAISSSSNFKSSPKKLKNIQKQQQFSKSQDRNIRKGSGNGILDNISTAFSKMMNDTQGFFLNYVEQNAKIPEQKFLDNILIKLYRSDEKAQKLGGIILKYLKTCEGKILSTQKVLLLIGNIFRKGPGSTWKPFVASLDFIQAIFKDYPQITSFADMLQNKYKLHEKVRKCLTGNFYLNEISDFKQLSVNDLSQMTIYLKQLVSFLKSRVKQKTPETFSNLIINLVCDDIYDLVSMLIVSVICVRKDNELQLRHDNMKNIVPMERMINKCLKSISDLSNYIGAHAIYSLEREYIAYQQEINLRVNPYYSSLQHFYRSSRNYKGLSIPEDYEKVYKQTSQKKIQSQVSPTKNQMGFNELNKQYFAGEEVVSDEQSDFKQSTSYLPHQQISSLSLFSQFDNITKNVDKKSSPIKNDVYLKVQKKKRVETKTKDDEKSSKGSKNQTLKTQSISFAQFGNIHIKKTSNSPNNSKHNDFNFFNQLKTKEKDKKISQPKPPLPIKDTKKTNKPKKYYDKQVSVPSIMAFDEFGFIHNQKKEKQSHKNANGFAYFDQFTKKGSSPQKSVNASQIFGINIEFGKQFLGTDLPPKENVLLQKILTGLKLKQLKDLLRKNEQFVIDFAELKISKEIGSGSAGQVYLGTYKQQSVAIKKVKAKQNPNALKQFERQLVTYIKIDKNPYLVSLVGISQSNADFYLITQFCSAGSLFDLLHKKKLQIVLSWSQRLRFAIQIAEGMKCLHQMRPVIIHRDLKSLNVFVTKQNDNFKMKVADFGLSRSPEAQMMTTQLGTIHWMAPELLQGKQYSLKVDVYSYGILLWEILSRKTPYSNLQNFMAIIKYVAMDHKRPQIDTIPLECPQQLIQVMQKCWAHQPNERPNFPDIIQQLRRIKI